MAVFCSVKDKTFLRNPNRFRFDRRKKIISYNELILNTASNFILGIFSIVYLSVLLHIETNL